MPLDPAMKALLDAMQAEPVPPLWQMEPAMARIAFVAMMEAVGPKDVPIGRTMDISIPVDGGEIEARIYTPVASGSGALPALVFFHGGGFVIGDIKTHDGLCRLIANESGARVVSVDYRLSPEHKFPVPVEDALAALAYVEANASTLGIDANALAVGGDSAGGALAAIAAQHSVKKGGVKLAYQMLLFPVTQIGEETRSLADFAEGYFLERQTLNWFYNHYLPADADRNDPLVSPLRAASLEGLPPAYVMLAGYDPLHDEGLAYANRLKEAGVAVTVADYPGMVHDFIYMAAVLPQAAAALEEAAAALRLALNPE